MTELTFGLLVIVGLVLGVVALFGYWHISDKLWRAELRCVILEHWCENLACNMVRISQHVDVLTQCHNNFVRDVTNGIPPGDINEADWWKKNEGHPPDWTPENN